MSHADLPVSRFASRYVDISIDIETFRYDYFNLTFIRYPVLTHTFIHTTVVACPYFTFRVRLGLRYFLVLRSRAPRSRAGRFNILMHISIDIDLFHMIRYQHQHKHTHTPVLRASISRFASRYIDHRHFDGYWICSNPIFRYVSDCPIYMGHFDDIYHIQHQHMKTGIHMPVSRFASDMIRLKIAKQSPMLSRAGHPRQNAFKIYDISIARHFEVSMYSLKNSIRYAPLTHTTKNTNRCRMSVSRQYALSLRSRARR